MTTLQWAEVSRREWEADAPGHEPGTDYFVEIREQATWPDDGSIYAGRTYETRWVKQGPSPEYRTHVVVHHSQYPAPDEPGPEPEEAAECSIDPPGQCSGPGCPGWLGEPCGCAAGAHDEGEPGGFYATARDHGRAAWLLGPYATHEEALAAVPDAKTLARPASGWRSDFWAFGTARIVGGERPPGKLNRRLGEWKASILADGTLVQYRKVGRGTVVSHACPHSGAYCAEGTGSHCYAVAFETGRYRGTTVEVWLAPDAVTTRPARKGAAK